MITFLMLILLFPVLSLAQEFQIADIINCSIALSRKINQENVLRARVFQADVKSALYPTLTASVAPTAAHFPNSDSNGNFTSLSVEQRIFDGETFSRMDVAAAALKLSRYELLNAAFQDANLALEDLSQIRALQNQIDLLNTQVQSYSLSEQIMSTGSKIGVSDSNDLLQLRTQILLNKTQVNQQQFELKRRSAVFMYRYGFKAVPLTDIKRGKEELKVDVQKLPSAVGLSFSVEQARFEKMVVERRLWPQLSLRGSYNGVHSEYPRTLRYPNSSVSVVLQVDLSNLWREWEQRELQEPLINNRLNRLSYTTSNLATEYEQLENELTLLKQQGPLQNTRLELAFKSKELSKAKLRLGKISFLELQQAEQAAFSAANDRFLLELRTHLLTLRKELAVGFEPQNLSPKNCKMI